MGSKSRFWGQKVDFGVKKFRGVIFYLHILQALQLKVLCALVALILFILIPSFNPRILKKQLAVLQSLLFGLFGLLRAFQKLRTFPIPITAYINFFRLLLSFLLFVILTRAIFLRLRLNEILFAGASFPGVYIFLPIKTEGILEIAPIEERVDFVYEKDIEGFFWVDRVAD